MKFLESFWKVFGKFLESFLNRLQKVFGKFLERIWKVFGKFLENFGKISERFRKVFGTFPRSSGFFDFFIIYFFDTRGDFLKDTKFKITDFFISDFPNNKNRLSVCPSFVPLSKLSRLYGDMRDI